MATTYEYKYLVIHGPQSKARTDYSGAPGYSASQCVGFGYTSHDGDPAICMHLKISDFKRTTNNKLNCTIYEAMLRALFPRTLGIGFGYPFTVSACFIIAPTKNRTRAEVISLYEDTDHYPHYGSVTLFKKSDYAYTPPAMTNSSGTVVVVAGSMTYGWNDGGKSSVVEPSSGDAMLSKKKTISIPAPSAGESVYLFISNLSECPCEQGGNDTIVYMDDISEHFPKDPDPYIWRLQQGQDPNHPDSGAAPAWHLVRPFYIYLEDKYGKGWRSCEDITKIV